jgi:hypothetical protein
MVHFNDAKELIKDCKGRFEKIKEAYDTSLSNKAIETSLLIEIKNFMENLRSALDYVALGLYKKYVPSSKPDQKIYFPYEN